MKPLRSRIGICLFILLGGFGLSSVPAQSSVPASVDDPVSKLRFEKADLQARQLAEILGIQTWAFKYTGTSLSMWVEIEEKGQNTPPKKVPMGSFGGSGKSGDLYFFIDERERRLGTGYRTEEDVGSSQAYRCNYNKEDLWFGWENGAATSVATIPNVITAGADNPTLGQQVTLLHITKKKLGPGAADIQDGPEVILVLKAAVFRTQDEYHKFWRGEK